ncbi:hypothetical protein ANCCEY_12092 [Ancylostoma ceylanicum]|uniref:mitogen-activated protein kinase kinase n=1 Tax=Ancylostoma ceylanicum TaxID=53326 RepID=A0A0D6LMG8_9BILA|nr:hypothetical protein ANCCEY_12092 [Ancylostoma ceylanicum]
MDIVRDMSLGFGDVQEEALSCRQRNSTDLLYQELMSGSGLLTVGGKTQRVAVEDLQFIAELGHGSCGHVSKMQYNDNVMAVKNEVMICMEAMATCLDLLLKRTGNAPIPEPIVGKMSVSVVRALHYLKENHVCVSTDSACLEFNFCILQHDVDSVSSSIQSRYTRAVYYESNILLQVENVIHRDVKPSNILLDWNGVVKLCDFGISGFLIESRARSKLAGCPPYMAPERVRSTEDTPYDIRSDVWSLGITLVELATGRFPYEGRWFHGGLL